MFGIFLLFFRAIQKYYFNPFDGNIPHCVGLAKALGWNSWMDVILGYWWCVVCVAVIYANFLMLFRNWKSNDVIPSTCAEWVLSSLSFNSIERHLIECSTESLTRTKKGFSNKNLTIITISSAEVSSVRKCDQKKLKSKNLNKYETDWNKKGKWKLRKS